MIVQKSFLFNFLALLICTLFVSCSYGQNGKLIANADPAVVNELLKKQVLLTNIAQFTGDRNLEGASGFLIKYNGGNFAVTARHLLGDAGGVEPEVKITDLSKALIKWEMQPRIVTDAGKETVKLSAAGLDFSQSVNDIVLLKVASGNFTILPLIPNFNLPDAGETLYLIGCPYSEAQCKQNIYPVKFTRYDEAENSLVCEIASKVNLMGFSGAPLVNGKGEVLGALVSGGEIKGKNYAIATSIKEIQKIR